MTSELVLGQAELLGDQIPGERYRLFLEVVAKGEIAEHFEEGVVAGGIADIVEVVVLAACSHAFLRSRRAVIGALLNTCENILELDHSGIGKHQRRIIAGHKRARRDNLMAVLLEIVQKCRPYLVDATHNSQPLILYIQCGFTTSPK